MKKTLAFCVFGVKVHTSQQTTQGVQMQVEKFKMKFLGKMLTFFRVLDADGEVLQICETPDEAQAWIQSNK